MPLDLHPGQFGPALLTDPAPEVVERLRLLPLDWFRDDAIHSMDYGSWAASEHRYLSVERERFDKLTDQIEKYGLLDRVEISWHGPGYLPHIGNGHHRVIALRRLGHTHAPYRWYNPTRRAFGEFVMETGPLPWTPLS
jgi:hypothetical protein